MSVRPLLEPIEKDTHTIKVTVLTNIVKMLAYRGWVHNIDEQIDRLVNSINYDQLYIINLDVNLMEYPTYLPDSKPSNPDFIGNKLVVKMIDTKITSMSKSNVILDFLTEYKDYHKILIVKSYTAKSKENLLDPSFGITEVFIEADLMINLMEIVGCPQYEVLTPEETDQFLDEYFSSRKQLKKMFDCDRAALYLFLKRKQVVRIIRDSEITGKAIDYRIVIHGKPV